MRIDLEARGQPSVLMTWLSPVIAIVITLFVGGIMFSFMGLEPLNALYVYFVQPLTNAYQLQELVVKATPLILIGVGLSVCFLSNNWNIGAEGQFVMGGIAGSWVALTFYDMEGFWILPLMMFAGALGGLLWALLPAFFKARFNANEILTSLMLTYVALQFLDYLVRGPLRDPDGFNFPESKLFSPSATMPLLTDGGRMHLGAVFAVIAAIAVAILLWRTIKGFEVKVSGEAPRAARFAGFSEKGMVYFSLLLSGALAGLAGISEVAGPIGQLLPVISPGYGFTAIIVAFLGRLNPIGVVFAGLLLALTYIGGENAQILLQVPGDATGVFQGILLFFILASDTLIKYRVKITGFSNKQTADGEG
jgi:general nucleoside transport system permease protein